MALDSDAQKEHQSRSNAQPTMSYPQYGVSMMQGMRPNSPTSQPAFRAAEVSSIEGLWVLLIQNDGELPDQDSEGRVPIIARAGNQQMYLLAFKNVAKARQFIKEANLDGADARMIVRANKDEVLRIARAASVVGTLLDYEATSQKYLSSFALA
jgi:hypothetical protein